MTQKEKIDSLKSTIYQLYSKEGRSISYISRLLEVDRKTLTYTMKEWDLPDPPPMRHLTPSNEKFLNKNRQLIKSRLDKNVTINQIALELGVSPDYLRRTIIKNDPVLEKADRDRVQRYHDEAARKFDESVKDSSRHYMMPEDFDPDEYWHMITGYSNYEISSKGRVRAFSKSKGLYYLLNLHPARDSGRLYTDLISDHGVHRNLQVARLVGFAFVRGYDEIHNTINHKNGIVDDNRVENLEWVSQAENNLHAYRELNRATGGPNDRRYIFKKIVYENKYEFKTVAAFARFLGKSETQTRRYLEEPEKHDIKLIV